MCIACVFHDMINLRGNGKGVITKYGRGQICAMSYVVSSYAVYKTHVCMYIYTGGTEIMFAVSQG